MIGDELTAVSIDKASSQSPEGKLDAAFRPEDVYAILSARRWRILALAATVSVLTPVTDTIILPALIALRGDLADSTDDSDAALVSVYMAAVGVSSLFWGPLSDNFGRRRPLGGCLICFFGVTLACLWSPSAAALLCARAAQGLIVSGTIAITQGIVADTFPPGERGTATGLYFVPLLIGPIISPVIGGALTDAFGWRSIFAFLAATAPLLLICVYFLPETLHRLCISALVAAPPCAMPWAPLYHLVDKELAPLILLGAVNFSVMFVTLTMLPGILSSAPHYLSPAGVGAAYLPIGFAMMAGSVLGGRWSDAAAGRTPSEPTARLSPALKGAALLAPGAVAFGFAARHGNLPGLLVAHIVVGLGQSTFQPGLFSFLSAARQEQSASVLAVAMALAFALAAAAISSAPPISNGVRIDGLFLILAACQFLAGGGAVALLWARGKCGARGVEVKT
jgi:predicted MFS family arabinose efflux permease